MADHPWAPNDSTDASTPASPESMWRYLPADPASVYPRSSWWTRVRRRLTPRRLTAVLLLVVMDALAIIVGTLNHVPVPHTLYGGFLAGTLSALVFLEVTAKE